MTSRARTAYTRFAHRTAYASGVWLPAGLFVGCRGEQSSLDPAGPQAARILALHDSFVGICAAVFAAVVLASVAALVAGIRRSRREGDAAQVFMGPGAPKPGDVVLVARERVAGRYIVAAMVATVVLLLIMLVASVSTGRALSASDREPALLIEVTGHQWWWDLRYIDPDPSKIVQSANELHLPVGRPVRLRLRSSDVIHSLWIPKLNGKTDLIPGEDRFTTVQADAPGVYRGQCAEFCGYQHAHMGLRVVAELPAQFDAWREAQQRTAHVPEGDEQARGLQVFQKASCPLCHSIRGTSAFANRGPDLTHVASRVNLAADTIPNERGHLAAWITDPQSIKPGTMMPPNRFEPADLQALLAYVEALR
jgi:cytochrome c oxidase subunit 2